MTGSAILAIILVLVGALAALMLAVAGYEVMARQKHRLRGLWGYGTGALSMFLSSFSIAILALLVLVQPAPLLKQLVADGRTFDDLNKEA